MDHNHIGTIDAHEMRTALKKAGEDPSYRRGLRFQMCPLETAVLMMVRAKSHS